MYLNNDFFLQIPSPFPQKQLFNFFHILPEIFYAYTKTCSSFEEGLAFLR